MPSVSTEGTPGPTRRPGSRVLSASEHIRWRRLSAVPQGTNGERRLQPATCVDDLPFDVRLRLPGSNDRCRLVKGRDCFSTLQLLDESALGECAIVVGNLQGGDRRFLIVL